MNMLVADGMEKDRPVGRGDRNGAMLAVEAIFGFALKGARRLVQLSEDEIRTLKKLAVAFMNVPEGERPEIMETMLEIVLPDDTIGGVEDEHHTSAEVRAKVDACRKYVGTQIKKHREALGMTQVSLAKRAKIPQSHVSRLERGKHAPSHNTITRLAKVLKVNPETIDPGYNAMVT